MKNLILFLSVLYSFAASASGSDYDVEVDVYFYTGSFGDMAKSLENQLAAKISESCGAGHAIEIKNLNVNYQLGRLSHGETLSTEIATVQGALILRFPHHPYAKALASFRCI